MFHNEKLLFPQDWFDFVAEVSLLTIGATKINSNKDLKIDLRNI